VWSDGEKNKTIRPESRSQPADIVGAVAAALWWRELVRKSAECRDRLHGFSPDIREFLRRDGRTFKNGKIATLGENERDRRRQEEALLARAETGEKILSKAIEFVADRVSRMIAATEAGKAWPLS